MSLKDYRAVCLSTDNPKSVDGLERAVSLLQGYFNDPLAAIDETLKEDPYFVMGHCFRGGLFLISSEKAAMPELQKSLNRAALAGRANDRERGHMAAMQAWLDGDFHRAAELYGRVVIEYPRDAIALQFAHQCDFLLGQSSQLRDRVARALYAWDESVPGYGYLLGMHAFGLEETNLYDRAEATGRRAVELNPRDTWAIHAVAHVYEMRGQLQAGIDWLSDRTKDWAPNNGFAFHNWWHLALYHLERGEIDRVLQLYDDQIHPGTTDVAMELVDAVALLWRLKLAGHDVGTRWADLADSYEGLRDDAYYAFNDAHGVMAFMSDGREGSARRVLSALERRTHDRDANGVITRDVGLPVCRAIHAFAHDDYSTTVDLLLPLRHIAHRFGGSHAQRDLLSQTLIAAAVRDGQRNVVRALLAERCDLRPNCPEVWRTAAGHLEMVGDLVAACTARQTAEHLSHKVAAA